MYQVFAASSSALEKAALSALTALVAVLTKGVSEVWDRIMEQREKCCIIMLSNMERLTTRGVICNIVLLANNHSHCNTNQFRNSRYI